RHRRHPGHARLARALLSRAGRALPRRDRRPAHRDRPVRAARHGRQPERLTMAWDFETDPDYQRKLDWVAEFVRTEVEPLDLVYPNPYDRSDPEVRALLRPLQRQVKEQGLWACHLGPELGGPGYGQLKLALLNEVLGTS